MTGAETKERVETRAETKQVDTTKKGFPTKLEKHCNAHGLCLFCREPKQKQFGRFICPNNNCPKKKNLTP